MRLGCNADQSPLCPSDVASSYDASWKQCPLDFVKHICQPSLKISSESRCSVWRTNAREADSGQLSRITVTIMSAQEMCCAASRSGGGAAADVLHKSVALGTAVAAEAGWVS